MRAGVPARSDPDAVMPAGLGRTAGITQGEEIRTKPRGQSRTNCVTCRRARCSHHLLRLPEPSGVPASLRKTCRSVCLTRLRSDAVDLPGIPALELLQAVDDAVDLCLVTAAREVAVRGACCCHGGATIAHTIDLATAAGAHRRCKDSY